MKKKFSSFTILLNFFFVTFFTTNIFAEPIFVGSTELRESRSATGITFNPDGTKMYILSAQAKNNTPAINDSSVDKLVEYDLSSPFSLVDAEASSAATEEGIRGDCGGDNSIMNPTDLHWNEDGKVLFMTEATSNADPNVCQVDINTAYDINELEQHSDPGFNMNDGSATDVSGNGSSAQGMDFSNDGLKLFIVGKQDDKVFEFSLSSKFNLTGAVYTGNSFDTSSAVSEPAAMRFSKDGKQLFINDATDDKIVQWSLSSAFDLTSTITLLGSFSIRADYQSVASNSLTAILEGLEFNNDGSKFFITTGQRNNTANSHFALEYKLDCPYGIVKCDPSQDENLVGAIEAQVEISKDIIKNSVTPPLRRIQWIRSHRNKHNLTNQNIKLNFSNKMLTSIAKAIPISAQQGSIQKKLPKNWHFWSEGDISVGRIGKGLHSSNKKIDTRGITFGADKMTDDKNILGASVRYNKHDVNVGSSKAYLESDAYSLIFYGSFSPNQKNFLDGVFGVSSIKINQKREFTSWNSGERNGQQLFGSFKLANSNNKNKNEYKEGYLKMDFGYTQLSEFTEIGVDADIKYDKQIIQTIEFAGGLMLEDTTEFKNSTLKVKPFVEHIVDISPSTDARLSYTSDPGTLYTISIGNDAMHNLKAGIGIDLSTKNGLSVIVNYERNQSYMNGRRYGLSKGIDSSHSDSLSLAIGYVPIDGTELALNSNEEGDVSTSLNVVKNINDYDLKFNLDYDLLNKAPNRNASILLSNSF